jgi:hypothetical protein
MVGREKLELFSYLWAAMVLGLTIVSQNAAAQSPSANGIDLTANARNLTSVAVDHSQKEGPQGVRVDPTSAAAPPPSNPLWAIPVESLMATRRRPIFTPSRRPAIGEMSSSLSVAGEPLGPPLVLLGAIAGRSGGVAIFRDQTTKDVIRLKTGESHSGWTLRLVNGREATFIKGPETSTLQIEIP